MGNDVRVPRTAASLRTRTEEERKRLTQPLINLVEGALDGKAVDGRWRVELGPSTEVSMGDEAVNDVAGQYSLNGFDYTFEVERAAGEPAHPGACLTCHGRKEIHRSVTHEEVTCPGCGGSGKRPVKQVLVMYLSLRDEPAVRGR